MDFIETWTTLNKLNESTILTNSEIKVIELLKPYKQSMSKFFFGKEYKEFPNDYKPIDNNRCAIIIPDTNTIYMSGSHLDMYLSCWYAIYDNIELLDKIFNISKLPEVYNNIEMAINNNLITYSDSKYESVAALMSDYLYESELSEEEKEYYQNIFIYAILYLFNVTYLRAEEVYLYWVGQYSYGNKINSYQKEQVEKFLDATFYFTYFKKGVEIWNATTNQSTTLSATDGAIVDDVMKKVNQIL